MSSSHLQCNYIYTSGGYYFTILTANQNNDNSLKQVVVETDSLTITEGQTIILRQFSHGNATASYALISSTGNINRYVINNSVSGQLMITKFDQTNQIVSGTFYFDAVNNAGDLVKVTDGRFDMHYTR